MASKGRMCQVRPTNFKKGFADLHVLEKVCRDIPVSLHGAGLSLGSAAPLDVARRAA